jgi:hypothetical protein
VAVDPILDDILSRDTQLRARTNMQGVADVSPEAALIGINGAPVTGLPASVGMSVPEQVERERQMRVQTDTIAASPQVAQWAANGDPAAVAASKDDFPSLARIGSAVSSFASQWYEDFERFGEANRAAALDTLRQVGARPTGALDFRGTLAIPVGAFQTAGIVPGAVLGATLEPAARALAPHLRRTQPLLPWEAPRQLHTREEQLQEARNILNTATLGLSAAGGRLGPRTPPPASPLAPKLEGPGVAAGRPREPTGGSPAPSPASGRSPVPVEAEIAQLDLTNIAAMQAEVAASTTFTRSPAVMEQFIAQQTGGRTVLVDPDAVLELQAQGHEVLVDLAEPLARAVERGEPLEVTLSKYLADTSGKPYADALNETTVFRPDGIAAADVPRPTAAAGEEGSVSPAAASSPQVRPLPDDILPEEAERATILAESSRAEVERVVADLRLRELFAEPEAVGTTKRNFERYSEGIENHIANVVERMEQRAYAAVRRERAPEWKERVTQLTAEVEQELAQLPVVRAYSALSRNKGPLGEPLDTPPVKLLRDDPLTQWALDQGLPPAWVSANGEPPDDVADVFGYATGADMIRDLSAMYDGRAFADVWKDLVREHATERTRDELGYDMSPEGIATAASEMVVGPELTNFLAEDLVDFATANGLPFDKDTMVAFAAERFAARPVKEATNIRQLEKLLARDNKKLETALLKGDVPTAFQWKQNQFLHATELAEAHKFRKLEQRVGRNIRRWSRKKAVKSIAPQFFDRLLEALRDAGIGLKRDLGDLDRALGNQTLAQWVAAQRQVGIDIAFAPSRNPLNTMTVDEFRAWAQMLDAIAKQGKLSAESPVEGFVQEALDKAVAISDRPSVNTSDDWAPKFGTGTLRKLDAKLSTLERVFDFLDGGDINGPWNRFLMEGATQTANRADQLGQDIYEPLVQAYEAIPKDIRRTYGAKLPDTTLTLPNGRPFELRRAHILPLALNLGTVANRTKLAEGYGTTVDEVLDLVNRYITPEEAKFVQFVWDTMDKKVFPLIDANSRKLKGYGLVKEPEAAVELAGRQLRGGYYPLSYDWRRAAVPREQIEDIDDLNPYRAMTTNHGFEKERTKFVAPIKLQLDAVLREHLRDVFTRLAYGEWIPQAVRFVRDKRIRTLVEAKLGHPYYAELEPWVARQVMDTGLRDINQEITAKLRRNMTTAVMGFKVTTLVSQTLGNLNTAAEIGLKYTIAGQWSFWQDVINGRVRETIYDKSEEMHFRHLNLEQNLREVQHGFSVLDPTVNTPRRAFRRFADFSMRSINLADKYFVSGAAWKGAYLKALTDLGMSEGDAIRYADKVVRKTQGTGRTKDLVPVQAVTNEFQRFWTFAYTPQSRMYNQMREAVQDIQNGRYKSGFNKAWWLFIAFPIIKAIWDGDFDELWELMVEKKEPEKALFWVLRKLGLNAVGQTPLSRDVTSGIDRVAQGKKPFDAGGSIQARFLAALYGDYGVIQHDKKGLTGLTIRPDVRSWFTLVGMLGVPAAAQAGIFAQAGIGLASGKQKPKNFGDWWELVKSGRMEK